MSEENSQHWRRCSTCKRSISFGSSYWACSVSTCNKKRSPMVFCTHTCWDAHVPVMNHRDSWCTEKRAPTREAFLAKAQTSPSSASSSSTNSLGTRPQGQTIRAANAEVEEEDILIVASKLKDYIRRRSGMNTSASVLEVLSEQVRRWSDSAILAAREAGRQTVMDRDVPKGQHPSESLGGNRTSSGQGTLSDQGALSSGQGTGAIIRRRPK